MEIIKYGGLSPVFMTMQAAATLAVAHTDATSRREAFAMMRGVTKHGLPPQQPAGEEISVLYAAYLEYWERKNRCEQRRTGK